MSPIPVIIVAGFLGSGKTTLLNHLLRNSGSARIGVVVNDFGAINIDSMLVAGQVDSMVSLGGGCVCCAVDVSELDELFDKLAHPQSEIDVIVVEASGLAEPKNLIRMVVGSANKHITYGGLVEVVDAVEFDATRARHPEVAQQLRLADLVVVNKADRAPASVAPLLDEVRRLVGQVPVVATTNARIDPTLLFDRPQRQKEIGAQLTLDDILRDDHDHSVENHRHLHDEYDSVSFASTAPLDPRALLELLEDPPPGLFRAKGFVAFAARGENRKFLLHTVGRYIRFTPMRWAKGEQRSSKLVLIGTGLDVDAALARLAATVHDDVEPLHPQTMLGIGVYV